MFISKKRVNHEREGYFLRITDNKLIYLNDETMNAIFDCVYGIEEPRHLNSNTNLLLKDHMFKDFIELLLMQREYNYRYRQEVVMELFPLFESAVGPMETNSDGTALWLALGLSIKELYGLRNSTLKALLHRIEVRK